MAEFAHGGNVFRTQFDDLDFCIKKNLRVIYKKNPGFVVNRAEFFFSKQKFKNVNRYISAKSSSEHVPEVRIEKY